MASLLSLARVSLFGSANSRREGGPFDPARDVPSLVGRTVLITGGAGDLGRQTAIELGRYGRPAHIVLADLPRADGGAAAVAAVREGFAVPPAAGKKEGKKEKKKGKKKGLETKKEEAVKKEEVVNGEGPPRGEGKDEEEEEIKITFLDLDLASLDKVQDAAARFVAAAGGRLDILVLNAGIMPVRAATTADGYELTFGVNYLGHALLARLLAPAMVATAERHGQSDLRVVVVASEGHSMAPRGGIAFEKLKSDCADVTYIRRYGQSKVALIGFTKELAARNPQLTVAAVHPGRISTGLAVTLAKESRLMRATAPLAPFITTTVELGARNHVWAATAPDVVSGQYYVPVGIVDKKTIIEKDAGLSKKLWEWTDNELKGRL